jgi:hypothetical protein
VLPNLNVVPAGAFGNDTVTARTSLSLKSRTLRTGAA